MLWPQLEYTMMDNYPEEITVTTIRDGRYATLALRDGNTIYIPDHHVAGKYVPRRVVLCGNWCPAGYVPIWSELRGDVWLYRIPALIYTTDPSRA